MRNARPKPGPVKHLTYYTVQAYKPVKGAKGQITAEDARPARDHDHAMLLFERFKASRAGVVAIRRTGSPAAGEWDEAVVIARHGVLPVEIDDMPDATDATD